MKQLTLCILTLFLGYKTTTAQLEIPRKDHRYHSPYSPSIRDENDNFLWFNVEFYPGSQENQKTIQRRLKDKLKTFSSINYDKKGNKESTRTFSYNELGRLTKIMTYSHKKEKSAYTLIDYLNDSIVKRVKGSSCNGFKRIYDYTYTYASINGKNLLTSAIVTKKGKEQRKLVISYNEAGKVVSRKSFYGHNLKKIGETKSEYNETGDLIKTTHFYNNKIKSVYNYDCNAAGKKVEDKKVRVSDVCKWTEERNDGSFIMYSRSTSNKKNYLKVFEYSKDSTLVARQSFLNDSILVASYAKYDNTETKNYFTEKQKLRFSTTSIYNDEHQILEHTYVRTKGDKDMNKTIYEYKNGNLTKCFFIYNNHKTWELNYEYNDKGLKTSCSYKKGVKQKKNYSYSYEYTFY